MAPRRASYDRLRELFARILAVTPPMLGTLVACGGAIETRGSSSDPSAPRAVCDPSRPPPFPVGLRASPLQDYVALRTESAFMFGATAPVPATDQFVATLSDASGTPCSGAADVVGCTGRLAALRLLPVGRADCEALYPNITHPGGVHPGCRVSYVVYTRGDEVGVAIGDADIRALIGVVDSVQEAEWFLRKTFDPTCGGDEGQAFTVRESDGGYEFVFVNNCERSSIVRTVFVARDGSVTERPAVRAPAGTQFSCAIAGRRPEGFVASARSRTDRDLTEAYFRSMADLEAASVVAFRRLGDELASLGAPSALLDRVREAERDELRHTAAARALAGRGHGIVSEASAPGHPRTALAIAVENMREGCVREAYGALLAWHQAIHAEDPLVRGTMRSIADEETAHAALAIDVAAWLDRLLDPREREAVVRERDLAFAALASELARSVDATLARRVGLPAPLRARAMLAGLATANV